MPNKVQARLDLPVRKTRSGVSTPGKVPAAVTPSRKLLAPAMDDPEKQLRTPRRKKVAEKEDVPARDATPKASPGKRSRNTKQVEELEKACKVSPSKQKKGAKTTKKENLARDALLSPSSAMSKLALNSPLVRNPLSIKKMDTNLSPAKVNLAKKGPLFSPTKLSNQNIEDLICSPSKTNLTKLKTPKSKGIVDYKNTPKSSIPLISPAKHKASPAKTKTPIKTGSQLLFSPGKFNAQSIEDLLCSPSKASPAKDRTPARPSNLLNAVKTPGDTKSPYPVSVDAPVRGKTPLPSKSVSRQSILKTPTKALFGAHPSPPKYSASDIENLLCSPVKVDSPKACRSPRKAATPSKLLGLNSPSRLLLSPVKTPQQPKVNPRESIVPSPTKVLFQPDISHYQQARQALNTSAPSQLLCREPQIKAMSSWLDSHLVSKKPGSLYVSGAPGTGKTATLTYLLKTKTAKYKEIFINCMVLKSSIAIYREVAKQLNPKAAFKTERDALKVIEAAITASGEMVLLVLDEVDQLDSKNQDVLYTVFEWPALSGSRLALVGIANALDLTDRVLPRLQVRDVYKPQLLHYPPYTKQQLAEIINTRLQNANDGGPPVITSRAVTFLAGKISSLSGDLRKALDVCRRALEMAETEARKQTLLKPMSGRSLGSSGTPPKSPRKGYKTPKPQIQLGTVDLKEIMKVINQVYGSQLTASLGGGASNNSLPLQQKLLMASLLLMVKKGKTKEVSLGKLMETYAKVCKKRKMGVPDESACVGMCEMLESRGIVTYKSKKGISPRLAKVSLRLDEDEVAQAMQDKTMLNNIMEDISCLAT